ncbi:MAG: hypothetical protein JEZ06_08785 [Anaerolineaceae bacterium]|nr:hypothetical protein [Anaerolineaceae bacterium]
MYAYIAWPPDTKEEKFPANFFPNDALDLYSDVGIVICKHCDTKVEYIVTKEEGFEDFFRNTHEDIEKDLNRQHKLGKCTEHPKPSYYN